MWEKEAIVGPAAAAEAGSLTTPRVSSGSKAGRREAAVGLAAEQSLGVSLGPRPAVEAKWREGMLQRPSSRG